MGYEIKGNRIVSDAEVQQTELAVAMGILLFQAACISFLAVVCRFIAGNYVGSMYKDEGAVVGVILGFVLFFCASQSFRRFIFVLMAFIILIGIIVGVGFGVVWLFNNA